MAKKKIDEVSRIEKLGLSLRVFGMTPTTFDEETKSIEGVLSTENPVSTWDWKRYEMVDEILLADSFEHPNQIPLLDSHNRASVKDQLGSIREIKSENGKLVGRLYFSDTEDARQAMQKVREGHLTDLSIGFIPHSLYVPEGETYKHTDGRSFNGPVNISKRTELKECSLTPIGADSFAKLRSQENTEVDNSKYDLLMDENRRLREVIKLVTSK